MSRLTVLTALLCAWLQLELERKRMDELHRERDMLSKMRTQADNATSRQSDLVKVRACCSAVVVVVVVLLLLTLLLLCTWPCSCLYHPPCW